MTYVCSTKTMCVSYASLLKHFLLILSLKPLLSLKMEEGLREISWGSPLLLKGELEGDSEI